MDAVIEARDLVKTFDADGAPVRAVDHVDLVVEQGETVSVMGPSGCGKSTLLHLLGGLERPFIVASFAARDGARSHAAIRAVGGTPRQTVISLIVSQLGACALALVLGIPLGLGLWSLMEGGDLPETGALLLVVVFVPIVFAAVVSAPARRLANRPVAPLLTYE